MIKCKSYSFKVNFTSLKGKYANITLIHLKKIIKIISQFHGHITK